MKVTDIQNSKGIKPLKHPLHEIPHLVIEPNYTCNITCKSCYNLNKNYVKSLEEIKSEIDAGLVKRRLETISILGGEPTLHPDLLQIIEYIKNKKLVCQILTNGVLLLADMHDSLLIQIIEQGVDRIILHTDIGQNQDPEKVWNKIDTLFQKFERYNVYYSLSITVYHENTCTIADIIKKYSHFKYFDGILALLKRNSIDIVNKASDKNIVELLPEYHDILKRLALEPVTYIPTSLDDKEISWLLYFYYINCQTYITYRISPLVNQIFRKTFRLLKGKQVFGMVPDPRLFTLNLLFSMLAEFLINPFNLGRIIKLVFKSKFFTHLRFHYILLQSGPEFNREKGKFQLCYHCPDATIRNGKITPVCLADLINPVNGTYSKNFSEELFETVYEHLEAT